MGYLVIVGGILDYVKIVVGVFGRVGSHWIKEIFGSYGVFENIVGNVVEFDLIIRNSTAHLKICYVRPNISTLSQSSTEYINIAQNIQKYHQLPQ